MLLNDIGRAPTTTLRKINHHLELNYGFKISETTQDIDLVAIMETMQGEIIELKLKGDDAKSSPEISKRLLVLEGIKNLREFAMVQLQSPKKELVIAALIDGLVGEFHKSDDFETELKRAMDSYRSSEFRFPENYIEQRVRDGATAKIIQPSPSSISGNHTDTMMEEEEDDSDDSGQENQVEESKMRKDEIDETEGGQDRSQEYTGDFKFASNPKNQMRKEKPVDPWAAQVAARRGAGVVHPEPAKKQANMGNRMKENRNLVRHLRTLLETEVSQAEVMMAAKGFSEELQEMIEKIGRLQNEDLPPVIDQMRETYGPDSASAFQTQIYGAFQGVMDSLYTAKDQVDTAVSSMATTGQVGMSIGMDKPMDDMGVGDIGGDEITPDLDNIGDEPQDMGEPEDEFGGAETEEPLGRAMKESTNLKYKIAEMKRIVEKARKIKESRK